MADFLLTKLQRGEKMSFREQVLLTFFLSFPAMLAQISSIVMQYIDASMVGHLGALDSAAIGLVSSSTWLFGGVCMASTTGFTVQAAQYIGGGEDHKARNVMKQGLICTFLLSFLILLAAVAISGRLPVWLGGSAEITGKASRYFLIYMLAIPAFQIDSIAGGMIQSSGNMKVPSILNIMACFLDVIFNTLLIFPGRVIRLSAPVFLPDAVRSVWAHGFFFPGAGMGITGAALGTALSELVIALMMLYYLLFRCKKMHLRREEKLQFSKFELTRAVKIAVPVGLEQIMMSGAQVVATTIVAPLGTISIAANSFAVTAESFCYMPGYGIESAATTLVGQSIGAGRKDMARRLAWISTGLGMVIMTGMGILMYLAAPTMIGVLSPDPEIRELGAAVLRIEAFAEPLFAASIVASGALRGAGDTLVPSCMNFLSMWAVRLSLAAYLAPRMGLRGVWTAMCIELCVRGTIFLIRLKGKRWMKK